METHQKPHPWVRFWARLFDYKLLLFIVGLICFSLGIEVTQQQLPYYVIGIVFIWIFIESFLLATWGSTPGKWLLRVHLVTQEGKKPTFAQALHRSFAVWWLGFAAGILPISLITMIVANVKLSNLGQTTWDKMYQCQVHHRHLSAGRIILVVILFILLSFLFANGIN